MIEDVVTALPFWNALSENEKALCTKNSAIKDYPQGQYLLSSCGSMGCLGMIHVLSGELRAFIISDEGREITLFRLHAGDNCVLSASCVLPQITFETQLRATTDAKLLLIPSGIYERLMAANIYVRCFTYELATERFSQVMWVMQQIIFYRFDQRLATFFLDEYTKTGKNEIRMTQEEIAEATNSAREVVARMVKQFASDGLIESKRGVIFLKDIEGLKDLK